MDGRNDGQGDKGNADNTALEQQMRELLREIEDAPVPRELHSLAGELQTALNRRGKSPDTHE